MAGTLIPSSSSAPGILTTGSIAGCPGKRDGGKTEALERQTRLGAVGSGSRAWDSGDSWKEPNLWVGQSSWGDLRRGLHIGFYGSRSEDDGLGSG